VKSGRRVLVVATHGGDQFEIVLRWRTRSIRAIATRSHHTQTPERFAGIHGGRGFGISATHDLFSTSRAPNSGNLILGGLDIVRTGVTMIKPERALTSNQGRKQRKMRLLPKLAAGDRGGKAHQETDSRRRG
jgi:hypothetical protein